MRLNGIEDDKYYKIVAVMDGELYSPLAVGLLKVKYIPSQWICSNKTSLFAYQGKKFNYDFLNSAIKENLCIEIWECEIEKHKQPLYTNISWEERERLFEIVVRMLNFRKRGYYDIYENYPPDDITFCSKIKLIKKIHEAKKFH